MTDPKPPLSAEDAVLLLKRLWESYGRFVGECLCYGGVLDTPKHAADCAWSDVERLFGGERT